MPTLLAILLLGSEVRQFNHSGLLPRLIDDGWRVVAAVRVDDADIHAALDPRIEITALPIGDPSSVLLQVLRNALDDANGRRAQRAGVGSWQYTPSPSHNWRGRLLDRLSYALGAALGALSPLYTAASRFEMRLLRRQPAPQWTALLEHIRPEVVLVNVPRAGTIPLVLSKAALLGSKTVLLYHTWKDVVVASGRVTHKFDRIGVWNPPMRERFRQQNPLLPLDQVAVIGCAHFDVVATPTIAAEVLSALKIDPARPFILFTASAPWVVPEEERYIRLMWEAIQNGALPRDLQIVVRTNPMDQGLEIVDRIRAISSEIIVAPPDWRWDKPINWCFQRPSDVSVYNTLLRSAAVNVSVPSTVTLECAIADLPVVNIGFEHEGAPPMTGSIRKFWEADFYAEVRATNAAVLAQSPDALIAQIQAALQDRSGGRENRQRLIAQQLGVEPGQSAAAAVRLIEDLAT